MDQHRTYNFNAGPAALPLEVLQQAQAQFVEYGNLGMSLMEISHRSTAYEQMHNETQSLLLELLKAPAGYKVLFMQGGASTQFTLIPMNFLAAGRTACYVDTGAWSGKALKEAGLIGESVAVSSSASDEYRKIPDSEAASLPGNAAYLHITSNETIQGTEYQQYPDAGKVPLIADMSSDILSRPVDVAKFAMIYAGAQKNLGPSGVTVIILRENMLEGIPQKLPTMFRYDVHAKNNSLYNTPPAYSIYIVNLVLKWIRYNGGLEAMAQRNRDKAALIYETIDQSNGFYRGFAHVGSRSLMNITFRLQTEELEKQFVQASTKAGFVGLQGHRSVGGLRASTYNAVPYEACRALSEFMQDFQRKQGGVS